MLNSFIDFFRKSSREFIGDEWMRWLIDQNISFNIRIRNNSYSVDSQGDRIRVDRLFYALKPGEVLKRRAQSILRYGLDCIRSEIFNAFSQQKKWVKKIICLLRPESVDDAGYIASAIY